MLRKRLIMRLGLLVVGFVTGAAVSIALLQGVLSELNGVNARAEAMFESVHHASTAASNLESRVHDAALGAVDRLDGLAQVAAEAERGLAAVKGRSETFGAEAAGVAGRALALAGEVRLGAAAPIALDHLQSDLAPRAAELKRLAQSLDTLTRRAAADEQGTLSTRLRTLIVWLTIAALVMTNVAIIVLVRTASMILRPVEQLLEGSRQLAQEHFEYRIQRQENDGEFGELAGAYNNLADQLASNEQKKVKALQHLAVTLNHELNNIINAIELQLQLVNRRAGGDPQLSARFADIHQNLERMTRTIASLRNVRRVVLTDYMPGEPMLDLPRSTAADELAVAVRSTSVPPPPTKV